MTTNKLFDATHSLVVVAGAGTGKTYNLVRRYLSVVAVNNPETGRPWADPHQAVAVTFTRAAAAEMRQRVIEELNRARKAKDESAFASDEVMREVWRSRPDYDQLIQCIDSAPIDTLHGLCASLLREFPELSNVPLDARPLEPGEESVRLERFVSRHIDAMLDGPDSDDRRDLVQLLEEVTLDNLKSELRAIIGEAEEIPKEWENADNIRRERTAFIQRQWAFISGQVRPAVEAALDLIPTALSRCTNREKTLGPKIENKGRQLEELLAFLKASELPNLEELKAVLKAATTESGKTALNEKNQDLIDAIAEIGGAYSRASMVRGKGIIDSLSYSTGHADRLARWVRFGRRARDTYGKQLRERSLVRFNDLEAWAITLLQSPEARKTLKCRFTHILVDEFQDTNGNQVKIIEGLKAACGDVVSFYVGDPKQSIYRFRGADVDVFQRQIDNVKPEQREELSTTFRTSPALGGFFNDFFPLLLAPAENGLDNDFAPVPWTEKVKCNRTANVIDGPPVDLVLRVKGKPGEEEEEEGDGGSSEALRLAAHIRALIDRSRAEGWQRKLCPKDFAVLLPKWSLAENFRSALESFGVAAELAGGRGLFQLPEVRDLINLIRFWTNWDDNLAAAGVLRGPCFGISDLGLYVLSRWPGVEKWDKNGSRWLEWPETMPDVVPYEHPRSLREAALKARINPDMVIAALLEARVLDPAKKEEAYRLLTVDATSLVSLDANGCPSSTCGILRMNQLTEKAGVLPTADLLAQAIVDFRLEAVWIKSPSGRRAVANAWRFVEMVRRIEADGPSLSDLVGWIDSGSDPTPEGLISGESDAVTITTLHGSKGLEWPVVAIAGLGAKTGGFGGASWASGPLTDLSGATKVRIPRIRIPQGGFLYDADPLSQAAAVLQSPAEAAENKRQLYVAMTRAKDRLVLSGELGKNVGHESSEKRAPLPMSACSTHAAYLGSLLDLQVTVTKNEDAEIIDPVLRPVERWNEHLHVVADAELSERPEVESTVDDQVAAPDSSFLDWGKQRTGNRIISPSLAEKEHVIPGLLFETTPPSATLVKLPSGEPTAMGNLFHAVMEDWNFTGEVPSDARLEALAERYFPGHGRSHVGWLRGCLEKFDRSSLAEELKSAARRGELFHEVSIDALLPKDGSSQAREALRAKGRMDLLFKDEKGLWCVVDYKATTEDFDKIATAYGSQLALYRAVIEAWRPGQVGRVGLWLAPAGLAWWTKPGD